MLQEHHFEGAFSWPDGRTLAVALTFDFQGGEDVKPLPSGKIDHEEYTQAEYGPNTGVWRILRVLEEEAVKATFLTCGGIAERYPDAVKAIVAKGHEVAGHGYHHEVARDLTREEEREVVRRTTEIITRTAGKRPVGWRSCTQSPNSLELLMEQGFLWNSNTFSFDRPFLWEAGGKRIVELPRQPFGDGRTYGRRDAGNPDDTLTIWKGLFDELYEESKSAPTFCPFQFHPYISGRPGRAKTLRELIRHMKRREGVWFATGGEVALLPRDGESTILRRTGSSPRTARSRLPGSTSISKCGSRRHLEGGFAAAREARRLELPEAGAERAGAVEGLVRIVADDRLRAWPLWIASTACRGSGLRTAADGLSSIR